MNILLLTDSDVFAGTERHMLDLAVSLQQSGRLVMIACPETGRFADRVRSADVALFPVDKGTGLGFGNVRRLVRALHAGQVDVIHAHNGRTALWGALAIWLSGRGKLIITQHFLQPARSGRSSWRRWLSQRVHRWIGARASCVVAISEAVRSSILTRHEVEARKVRAVLNGIVEPERTPLPSGTSIRELLRVPAGAPLIVCCARLELEKQVNVLIDAIGLVAGEMPNVRCVVAGEGKLRPELEAQIQDKGLHETLTLLGFRSDALEIVAAGDLFVLPSLAEPFGLSLVEAMALGKPVIATKAGGPMEIVVPEATGLLVAPSNPAELGAAILRLLQDPQLARSMGCQGRERFVQSFTAARMARELESIYGLIDQNANVEAPLATAVASRS